MTGRLFILAACAIAGAVAGWLLRERDVPEPDELDMQPGEEPRVTYRLWTDPTNTPTIPDTWRH